MGTVEEEFESNSTELLIPILKYNPKGRIPFGIPESDNIIEGNQMLEEPTDPGLNVSSIYMIIFLPVAAVVLVIALAATFKWRYTIRNQHTTGRNKFPHTDNNNIAKAEEGRSSTEEGIFLKTRSLSSSTSSINHGKPIGGITGVISSMRIIPATNDQAILKSSRRDFYCEISPDIKESEKSIFEEDKAVVSVKIENKILKERTDITSTENIKSLQSATKPVLSLPKRPNTLQVLSIAERTTNANSSKGFPWSEQLWTPDADIIYEDIESPENNCEINKERQDHIFPLMAKGRFKMKPKGLLERRGSNVALTISLKNEGKTCSSPPPSSKSPKPLVYLQTASAKLDPIQLHIKANNTTQLQEEFWEVPMNHPSEKHFCIPGYGTKNRYRSILPNPHSRVLLPATQSCDPLSAYINANYVRGYSAIDSDRRKQSEDGKENDARRMSMKRKASFIATQGPMMNTIVDFWKMIWREKSTAIVMITKLKERKEKCSEYMPSSVGEVRKYENFQIEVKHVRYADHYSVRTVEVRNQDDDDEIRTFFHYWYSEWLDHDTPDKLRGLLTLIQEVDLRYTDNTDSGPVVVHCSAGIGRTGCFIAISIGCRQLKIEGKVDTLKIICQLRMDRGGMIQTWEQYQYVHIALSRYSRILAGENVNTPSTASSIRSPNSSLHSTPSSAGVNQRGMTSPQSGGVRLFSPRAYLKPPVLDTVTESGATPSDNESPENPDVKIPRNGDIIKSVFSPRPNKIYPASRFSFSCADSVNGDGKQENGRPEESPGKEMRTDEILINGLSSPKRTKNSVIPPKLTLQLNLKSSPVREENWLLNGHCTVTDQGNIDVAPQNTDHCPNDPNYNHMDAEPRNNSTTDSVLDSRDLGKLKNILSPTAKNCQTPKTEQKSIFMFPSPQV